MGTTVTPSNIIVAPATVKVATIDVGALTDDGVTLSYERDYLEIGSDSAGGILGMYQTMERLKATWTMEECTLDNLKLTFDLSQALIWAGASRILSFGGLSKNRTSGGYQNEKAITIESMSPGYGGATGTRTITIHKAVFVGAGEHVYAKNAGRFYPVEVTAVEDSTKAEGQKLCTIMDA